MKPATLSVLCVALLFTAACRAAEEPFDVADVDGRLDCPQDDVVVAAVENYVEGVAGFGTRDGAVAAAFAPYLEPKDRTAVDDRGYVTLVRDGREIAQAVIADSGNGFAVVEIAGCRDPLGSALIRATPPQVP